MFNYIQKRNYSTLLKEPTFKKEFFKTFHLKSQSITSIMKQMTRTGYFNGNLCTKLHKVKKASKTLQSDMKNIRSRIFFIQSQDMRTWKRITSTKNLATKVLSVKKEKDLRSTNVILSVLFCDFDRSCLKRDW